MCVEFYFRLCTYVIYTILITAYFEMVTLFYAMTSTLVWIEYTTMITTFLCDWFAVRRN